MKAVHFFPRRDRCGGDFLSVGHHQEDRRVAPRPCEGTVRQQDQRIALLETDLSQVLGEHLAILPDLLHLGTVAALEVEVLQLPLQPRKARRQHDLDHVLPVVLGDLSLLVLEVVGTVGGQQPFRHEQNVEQPHYRDGDADVGKVEHLQPLEATVEHHAVHDQVGRCPDEGAETTQDGGVRQRDEELRAR